MTAPRSLADIAAELVARLSGPAASFRVSRQSVADELVALDADYVLVPRDRWPSADEIAELRRFSEECLRRYGKRTQAKVTAKMTLAFLDRLDPPTPTPVADDGPDWRALVVELVETLESQSWDGRLLAAARAALAANPAPTEDGDR